VIGPGGLTGPEGMIMGTGGQSAGLRHFVLQFLLHGNGGGTFSAVTVGNWD
jgi:hypothetical protein